MRIQFQYNAILMSSTFDARVGTPNTYNVTVETMVKEEKRMLISFSKNALDKIRPIFEGIPLRKHLTAAFDTGCLAAIK